MKKITIGELFTEEELQKAFRLSDVNKIEAQIVKPAIARINQITGQENDSKYWAYCLVYMIQKGK